MADRRAHADLITHTLAPVVHVPIERGRQRNSDSDRDGDGDGAEETEAKSETLLSTSFQCAEQKMKKKMAKERTKKK